MKNQFSFWELQEWFRNVDFTVIGSGIVGLQTAIRLKERFPEKKVLVLEKGKLPNGASTKNAGFACFGSLSEIVHDLQNHTEQEVVDLIERRYSGLKYLRNQLGDEAIDYKAFGGYELFVQEQNVEAYMNHLDTVNTLLKPLFKKDVFTEKQNSFGFKKIKKLLFNGFEGQINTGKMMQALLQKSVSKGVLILNGISLQSFEDTGSHVKLLLGQGMELETKKLLVATNGFSKELLKEDIVPARAQVLITKPIENLKVKGTFHLDGGYYYFRNIENRVLFGGGRNLDFKTEETTEMGLTRIIQSELERLLQEVILPDTQYEIEHRWSGIMGVGKQKKAIVKRLSENVCCGVRLGGMGVAVGSWVGKELGDLV